MVLKIMEIQQNGFVYQYVVFLCGVNFCKSITKK